jgi:hypothetical protein
MGQSVIYECDICKKFEKKIGKEWFEFDYEYNSNSLAYLVCSFKCYIIMLDRCYHWSMEHSNVRIGGMSKTFVKKLLEGVNVENTSESKKVKFIHTSEVQEPLNDFIQELQEEPQEHQQPTFKFKIETKGKIISIKEPSCEKLDWLENFAFENNDSKLLDKCKSIWEHENLITYDSLIDIEQPNIPLIRYKNYYILFIYESLLPFFNQIKRITKCNIINLKTIVYVTEDYKIFSRIIGNRALNPNKIKRIKFQIESGLDMLPDAPIICTENINGTTLDIIDGQHRFNVARLMKLPVYYIIRKPLTLPQIAIVNSNQEKWNPNDIINCFIENGNKNYEELNMFKKKYKFPISVCRQLLSKGYSLNDGGVSEGFQKEFEEGKFIVSTANEAYVLAEIIEKFSFFKEAKKRLFIISICKILKNEKIQIIDLVNACLKNSGKLEKQHTWKSYINNLELIYNIGKHSRVIIY